MKENKTYKEWLKQENAFEASVTVEGKTKNKHTWIKMIKISEELLVAK